MKKEKYINREISWLSFNHRVLQEAKDQSVPLLERIKFLAIFSSNLDEFFRVRVASIRSLLALKEEQSEVLKFKPHELLSEIHATVNRQQEEFGEIYRNQIIPLLEENNIQIANETDLSEDQLNFVSDYYEEEIKNLVNPMLLDKNNITPFLQNHKLYLTSELKSKVKDDNQDRFVLIEIPSDRSPRYVRIPDKEKTIVIALDDIIRANLSEYFPGYDVVSSYAIKLTRDASLNIDDEFSGNLLSKIKKGLKKRNLGPPSRFLYDMNMPKSMLDYLKNALDLSDDDLFRGGRYHNLSDLFGFAGLLDSGVRERLSEPKQEQIRSKKIDSFDNIFDALDSDEYLLTFPYHAYEHVLDFFAEAAEDPDVTEIKTTQYRVAKNSSIVKSLIKAAENGKKVTVFVEVKARFDEELNIKWARAMEEAGVTVFYSIPGLKVHAKIALVTRKEVDSSKNYCYLSTGNFNENNAKIYTDFGLLTSDARLTDELEKVFDILIHREEEITFEHLLVAQFNMRSEFKRMIENEIAAAERGEEAWMTLKMNGLEDKKMIDMLYKASKAGVKITIICRGVCCLNPDKNSAKNIEVISIIDKYLEHIRAFVFCNGGKEKIYIGSADWMKRNLSRRIEVVFPIYGKNEESQIREILRMQIEDSRKARLIDGKHLNEYRKCEEDGERCQLRIYEYLMNNRI